MSESRTSIPELEASAQAVFKTVLAYSPIGVAIASIDGRMLIVNEVLARFLGRAEEELIGLPIAEITHPGYRSTDQKLFQQLITGKRLSYTREKQFLRKDGRPAWARVTMAAVGAAAVPSLVVAIIEDVTAHKVAAARAASLSRETAEQRDLFQALLDQLPVAVVVTNTSEQVIMRNEASRLRPAPYAAENLSGAYAGLTAYRENGKEYAPEERPLMRALRRGEATDYEVMRLERDGTLEGYIYAIAAPIRNQEGAITAAVLVYGDITALKHAEQRREQTIDSLTRIEQGLKRVNKEAQSKEETMRQALETILKQLETEEYRLREAAGLLANAEQREREHLATLLHDDLAQALAVIKMNLSALRQGRTIEEVKDQAGSLLGLVDEAIASTRSLVLELAPPQLMGGGLQEALPWWASRIEGAHGLRIVVNFNREMARFERDAEVTLFQAVKELLNNIVKHAQATEVQVVVDCSDRMLELLVSDNGVGFVPTRVTDSESFGLSNIRQRLGYLGGEMSIDSAPGAGTKVRLRVPLPCGVASAAAPVGAPA